MRLKRKLALARVVHHLVAKSNTATNIFRFKISLFWKILL